MGQSAAMQLAIRCKDPALPSPPPPSVLGTKGSMGFFLLAWGDPDVSPSPYPSCPKVMFSLNRRLSSRSSWVMWHHFSLQTSKQILYREASTPPSRPTKRWATHAVLASGAARRGPQVHSTHGHSCFRRPQLIDFTPPS